ncbi:hypothetical protein E5K00_22575 [Hymenobacter aquaticus]|uniref:Cell wall anchor protein n=1 Tax=Hymenobacter aquaticus TaxID=1867101 RepID=A0A4Z0PSX6_9BACT|nr:hypothetical protein [Hymenobacter aquaticus]TGE20768.1 hypothetical protein E5K00_22575 [Hymenobacter aquaticus]
MKLKHLLRPLLVAATVAGVTSAAQAQELKTYAPNSHMSLTLGSAFSTNLWSTSYIGFNLNKSGLWNSDWRTDSDGTSNGAGGIVGLNNGTLAFLAVPDNNPAGGGRILSDVSMPSFIKMRLHPSGMLQLGDKTAQGMHQDAKLSVYGKITANSLYILADNPTNWADYVFAKGYKLTPLRELEAYVQKNQHLPEIPTTAEVTANGVNLGEMNVLLLKKVEELTLHLIEMDKKLEALSAQQAGKQ